MASQCNVRHLHSIRRRAYLKSENSRIFVFAEPYFALVWYVFYANDAIEYDSAAPNAWRSKIACTIRVNQIQNDLLDASLRRYDWLCCSACVHRVHWRSNQIDIHAYDNCEPAANNNKILLINIWCLFRCISSNVFKRIRSAFSLPLHLRQIHFSCVKLKNQIGSSETARPIHPSLESN